MPSSCVCYRNRLRLAAVQKPIRLPSFWSFYPQTCTNPSHRKVPRGRDEACGINNVSLLTRAAAFSVSRSVSWTLFDAHGRSRTTRQRRSDALARCEPLATPPPDTSLLRAKISAGFTYLQMLYLIGFSVWTDNVEREHCDTHRQSAPWTASPSWQ